MLTSHEEREILTTLIRELFMATLEQIDEKLDKVLEAIAAIPASTATVDLAPVLTAISDLKTEIVNNVEGEAPAPAPAA